MTAGDLVWFRPAQIGYGYVYGPDRGIPARVVAVSQRRVRIVFKAKNSDMTLWRYVMASNLDPRLEAV